MKHTEIVLVLDRSGSMQTIYADTLGGVNHFIEEQQKVEGSANLTINQFDHEYLAGRRTPLASVQLLTRRDYVLRGSTALLDAVARSILDLDALMAVSEEPPGGVQVVFAIVTDGLENSSREHKLDEVKKLVAARKTWDFQFIGIGLDDWAGEAFAHSMNVQSYSGYDRLDTRKAFAEYSKSVTSSRTKK